MAPDWHALVGGFSYSRCRGTLRSMARRKPPVLKRHTRRCAVESVSKNVRHFIRVKGMPQPQAVAVSLNVLKRACGCGPKRMQSKMTPREIVSRCPR